MPIGGTAPPTLIDLKGKYHRRGVEARTVKGLLDKVRKTSLASIGDWQKSSAL